jgi:hypothetical protein
MTGQFASGNSRSRAAGAVPAAAMISAGRCPSGCQRAVTAAPACDRRVRSHHARPRPRVPPARQAHGRHRRLNRHRHLLARLDAIALAAGLEPRPAGTTGPGTPLTPAAPARSASIAVPAPGRKHRDLTTAAWNRAVTVHAAGMKAASTGPACLLGGTPPEAGGGLASAGGRVHERVKPVSATAGSEREGRHGRTASRADPPGVAARAAGQSRRRRVRGPCSGGSMMTAAGRTRTPHGTQQYGNGGNADENGGVA